MSSREGVASRDTNGRDGTAPPSQIVRPISYTIKDSAQVSGLGRSTLYKCIRDKKLETVLVCGRRLILADSLEALVRGGVDA